MESREANREPPRPRVGRPSTGAGCRSFLRGGLATLGLLGALLLPGAAWAGRGDLLWEDTVGRGDRDQANGVAVREGWAIAVGRTGDTDGNLDILVRAYDLETGALLWEDQLDRGTDDGARSVSVRHGRAFVAGHTGHRDVNTDFLVRAHDAATGALLWEDTVDRGDSDAARTVAARGGRVVVSGQSGDATNLNWLVRTYDAAGGALLWEDEVDRGTGDLARSAALSQGRVFVVGHTGDAAVNLDGVVRAYDAATGALLWEQTLDEGNADTARRVAAAHGRVFVAGDVGDRDLPGGGDAVDWLVRAHDAATGALLWEDRIDLGERDQARAVIVKQDRVFVAGTVGTFGLDLDIFVRAYNAANGSVIWDDRIQFGTRDQALSLGVYGSRLFVGGHVGDFSRREGNLDFFFRAYESPTGQLLFEDRIDVGKRDGVRGIGIHGGRRAVVVGQLGDPQVNLDFAVRTYSAR